MSSRRSQHSQRFGLINTLILALCVCGTFLFYLNAQQTSTISQHDNIRMSYSDRLKRDNSAGKQRASSGKLLTRSLSKTSVYTTTTATAITPITKKPFAPLREPDGTFNTIPIYYRTSPKSSPPESTYHCVGENFRTDAWLYRSCSFRNLCFDMDQNDFVIFTSPQEAALQQLVNVANSNATLSFISSTGTPTLSIGGINPKWRKNAMQALQWFPRQVIAQSLDEGYYELEANSVWIPFHSLAGYNAGHLFWDDFFPIFKLLTMFDLVANDLGEYQLLLTKIERKMWGTCDWNPKNTETCKRTFAKFLPAMGLTNHSFSSTYDYRFLAPENRRKSRYICAPRAAAGLGLLTDHGLKMHGWDEEDMETTHNAGRGHVFYDFRNFMLRNLGLSTHCPETLVSNQTLYKVIFSRFSSSTKGRVKGFGKQEKALKESPSLSPMLNLTGGRLSKLELHEQASMTCDAAIFVTCVGGGSMTATFLPRGSTLILFYEATGGRLKSKDTGKPARLDWDVLNHASSLRVHWLPIESMDEPHDLRLFTSLVEHELKIIQQMPHQGSMQ